MSKRIPGIYYDYETQEASIDKRVKGIGRIRRCFKASSYEDAAKVFYQIIRVLEQEIEDSQYKTFAEAAAKYLKESTHRSIGRYGQSLELLMPFIGHLPINQICMDTLQPYITKRRKKGIRSSTIRRDLAAVGRVLSLCARSWRTSDNRPWLQAVPIIDLPDWEDEKENYPLEWSQQQKLFKLLPDYLARMALFAVNTGAREQVVCWLRWEWEIHIEELKTSIFITPGRRVKYTDGIWPGEKNKVPGIYLLNKITRSVIEEQRGMHPELVFPFINKKGKMRRLHKMQTTSWKTAWRKADLPADDDIRKGPHNLRHTFARRLRNAGVSLETRKALLNHKDNDVTLSYSPAEIQELINAVERLTTIQVTKSTVIRAVR